jgi:hypothetical protein
VFADRRPDHLDVGQASLRNGLRAKWRQLGGDRALLIAECAYEQWHRLLFARFLAENNLLLHPQFRAPVTLQDCEELSTELGEPDGWAVAARFAAEILPGIFPLDDPCARLRLAPEGRFALEDVITGLPADVFAADDALGWVYQFWQKDKKDEINASERKIGGADLGPVTQLFTENYMVRFLLENSLGAWWAGRYPDSSLHAGFHYLRRAEDGTPAAGSFDAWPAIAAEVTVMDPCCGSGHFLVEAFSMLWQMRAEEEALSPIDAQDAVLRDNLFGLELDPRCVQIAMFAVALQAWKAGGGWRQLPVPHVACSGIPVKAPVDEWTALAHGNQLVQSALVRLHGLFLDADTLGSLIDPKGIVEAPAPTGPQRSFEDSDWDQVIPVLSRAARSETSDPATSVLGADVTSLIRAASFLSRDYTLIATNVPFLSIGRQSEVLRRHTERSYPSAAADLATVFLERSLSSCRSLAVVTPQSWHQQATYEPLRRRLLATARWCLLARLGNNAWQRPGGGNPYKIPTVLSVFEAHHAVDGSGVIACLDIGDGDPEAKSALLSSSRVTFVRQEAQLANPAARIVTVGNSGHALLREYASSYQGMATGDYGRFGRFFWEQTIDDEVWECQQSTVTSAQSYGGREHVVRWERGSGALSESPAARIQGSAAWAKRGVAISQMGELKPTLYTGEIFDNNVAAVIPRDNALLPALWAYCASGEHGRDVRTIDRSIKVTNATLLDVPFDVERWRTNAEKAGSLPDPWSADPTQWLFQGRPEVATAPLHVAVGRLLGYEWPLQPEMDDLTTFADADGIVCIPSVAGEAPAADRVQQVVAAAFGAEWSPGTVRELLQQAGSKANSIGEWLAGDFFKQHCALFGNRPFIWQIWDGERDGFSALVNYHRLDRRVLEKLTYTHLGQDWVERQRAGVRAEVAGAESRLAAAADLQDRLEAILEGESPFDIYVRWKPRHEQPLGWQPDLNDGVRVNIRPFVEAGVLRSPFNIHWRKDRGKDPDGSERRNDIHLSIAERRDARKKAGVP